jgi:hypothetical protein
MGRTRLGVLVPWCVLAAAAACSADDRFEPMSPAARKDAGDAGLAFPTFDGGGDFVDTGTTFQSQGIPPTFGTTSVPARRAAPISGGTLIVSRDGSRAIASDPDRDAIYIVDLAAKALSLSITMSTGEEPGRLVEDGAGRVHVALRGGGALLTIDESTGNVLARRAACPAPRGVTWDASSDLVWVACATGEVVALPAAGGPPTTSFVVERDLRDVAVINGSLSVSKFRSASVLRLSQDGVVARRDPLPAPHAGFTPQVAWRTVATDSGDLVSVHQMEADAFVPTHVKGGYGSGACGNMGGDMKMPTMTDAQASICPPESVNPGCFVESDSVVKSVLTVLAPNGGVKLNRVIPAAVPVDVAVTRDGSAYAAIAAGNAFTPTVGTVMTFEAKCGNLREMPRTVGQQTSLTPIAIAFDAQNDVLVQTREPAQLWRFDAKTGLPNVIPLSSVSRADTGLDVFYTQAGAMMACASCHPEGGDDGHVWMLDGAARRTPSLRGTIAGTAPYHWPGDEADLDTLVNDVYTQRMSGVALPLSEKGALTSWVQTIPAPPPPSYLDPGAVARGKALFQDAGVGCATCHAGDKLTNNKTVDVGTGGAFQVPPLVGVGWRTPLMHDGCAATMADRFGACSTPGHGDLSSLSPANVADLTTYLESL